MQCVNSEILAFQALYKKLSINSCSLIDKETAPAAGQGLKKLRITRISFLDIVFLETIYG